MADGTDLPALRRELEEQLNAVRLGMSAEVRALRDGVAGELATIRESIAREASQREERSRDLRGRLDEITGQLDTVREAFSTLTGWPDDEERVGGQLRTRFTKLERRIDQQAEDLRGATAALVEQIAALRRLAEHP